MKNSKPTTLAFESDFDFETANAQFNKNELVKEASGELTTWDIYNIIFVKGAETRWKYLSPPLQMGRRRWNRV